MASIARRIYVSHCNGQRMVNNEFSDFSADLVGSYSPQRATRKLRRDNHDSTITINNVEIESGYYKMEAFKFMHYAERSN